MMRCLIAQEAETEMKQAYTEMLEGCLLEPDNRIWYAEIGYGLKKPYRHHGYMSEAVKVITKWALSQDDVRIVEAETDGNNIASQKVLMRAGFIKNGKIGEEGPRFVYGGKRE